MRLNDWPHVFMKPPHFLLFVKVVCDGGELDDFDLMLWKPSLSACCLKVQDQEIPQPAGHDDDDVIPGAVKPYGRRG